VTVSEFYEIWHTVLYIWERKKSKISHRCDLQSPSYEVMKSGNLKAETKTKMAVTFLFFNILT
jgi:hypothetical protein